MLKKQKIERLDPNIFTQLGWDFFISEEIGDYIFPELILVNNQERDAYYNAANELYDMFVAAAQKVIDDKLYAQLDIPANAIPIIEASWDDDRNFHLFGRFDFAGGADGLPIKLMEFNADTPSSLPETAIIQWAQLKSNKLDEKNQFNFVYEALVENFGRLRELNSDLSPRLLVTTFPNAPEDDLNVGVLSEAAREAGFEVDFAQIDEVVFSEDDGIFVQTAEDNFERYDFWFKLVPWESMAWDEPELLEILTAITKKRKAIILNPAYTLLFQSKGILKILWDLYPNHPLLLKTTFEQPTHNLGYVRKVMLGREGSDVAIFDELGTPIEVTEGEYADQKVIYQQYTKLNTDEQDYHYQAGVFFAYEGCGLGFRRNASKIIDNAAHFIGHYVAEEEVSKSRFKFW